MATTVMKAAKRVTPKWPVKDLRQARREIAALRPGDSWSAEQPLTVDEFYALTPPDTRAELFEGVICVPPPDDAHEALFVFLITLLNGFVQALNLGEVRGSRSGVRLDDFSAPQPDILFVRKSRRHVIRPGEIIGPPDLIMEIIRSNSSRSRALAKVARYEQFGVPELWVIDLPRQLARILVRNEKGEYQEAFNGRRGVLSSEVVPGFAVRARWLWAGAHALPNPFKILQELIAGRLPR
jgi:Uma2 family endonuclease